MGVGCGGGAHVDPYTPSIATNHNLHVLPLSTICVQGYHNLLHTDGDCRRPAVETVCPVWYHGLLVKYVCSGGALRAVEIELECASLYILGECASVVVS